MIEEGVKIIWQVLQGASPIAALICFLVMLVARRDLSAERDERKAVQAQLIDVMERAIKGLGDASSAVQASTQVALATQQAIFLLRDALTTLVARSSQHGG